MKRKIGIQLIAIFTLFAIMVEGFQTVKASEMSIAEQEQIEVIGSQIRTVNPMGLRFLSSIQDSYIEELEKTGEVEYGTVILPAKYLGDKELKISEKYLYNGKFFKPLVVKAEKIYAKKDGKTYFTAVLTDISKKSYQTDYVSRAYIKIKKAKQKDEIIYSGDTLKKQVYQVSKDAINGTVETTEVKEWLQKNVVDVVDHPENHKPQEVDSNIKFQLGEVTYVGLYHQNSKKELKEIGSFTKSNFQKENYLVKLEIKNQPTLYAEIEELVVEEKQVKLKLKLEDYVHYKNGKSQTGAVVDFGTIEGNKIVSKYSNARSLIARIKENPSGNFSLLSNLDFSGITTQEDELISNFSGTLDGNGYSITGLKKTLFGEVSNGSVKNLIIKDVNINKTGNHVAAGVLADIISKNSVIENVHVVGTLTTNRNKTGGLIGDSKEQSIIRYCSANMNITNTNNNAVTAGLVGETSFGVQIHDSYATGSIKANAKGVGGLVGWHRDSHIERNYSAVHITSEGTNNMPGGFLGYVWEIEKTPGNIQNNISFSYGKKGYKFDGMSAAKEFTNRYLNNYTVAKTELIPSELTSDSKKNGINVTGKITEKNIDEFKNKDFYTNILRWDEAIWDFSDLSEGKAPKLKGIDPNTVFLTQNVINSKTSSETVSKLSTYEEKDNSILSQLQQINGYQESHQKAYQNLLKFMPFYSYEQIIKEANQLDVNHKLNQFDVLTVYPLNTKGERIVGMTQEQAEQISKIRIQFTQTEVAPTIYNVNYINVKNHIASYQIEQIPVHYTFKRYIINKNSEIFLEVVNKAKTYNYDNDLMNRPVGGEHNSIKKALKNNFKKSILPEMEEMFVSYFTLHDELPLYLDHPVAQAITKQKVLNEDYLKDYLTSYNYFDRWYDFVIGGINIRDVVLFDNDVMPNAKDPSELPIEVNHVNRNSANDERWGRRTQDLYRNRVGKYTGISEVDTFVEYFMKNYARYEDVNDWIIDNFQNGVLVEAKPKNENVRNWRLWEKLKQNNFFRFKDMVLPTLSYKTSENLFIGSTTTYLVFGNLESYPEYQNTEQSRMQMRNKIQHQLNEHATIFDNYATLSSRGAEGINNSKFTIIDQNPTSKRHQDVFVEYFEPLSAFMGGGGPGGAAVSVRNGNDYIYFNSSNYINNIAVTSHELGHVTDSVIFMDGKGFRSGRTGEDINNGFTNQDSVDYNMNLMRNYSRDGNSLTNLTPDRINTDAKFKEYYSGVFEALYTLDYLQGLAYLQLTPAQQAAITAKHYYGTMNATSHTNQVNSTFKIMSANDMENMNLKTIEDLWDNQITIRPGHRYDIASGNNLGSQNAASYNIDRVAYVSWYVPYVENGSPHAQVFRRNAYELGGIGGFVNGTQEYLRWGNTQDLERWKQITKDPNFNFKSYRMNRFKDIENKIKAQKQMQNSYINVDEIVAYLKHNMIHYGNGIGTAASNHNNTLQNIKHSRENVFRYLHRITNEFRTPIFPTDAEQHVVEITNANQLVTEMKKNPSGIFKLKNDIAMNEISLENNVYVNQTFIGKLDGNGYKITGLKKHLLKKISNSYVTNITLIDQNGNIDDKLLASEVGMIINVKSKKTNKDISTLEDLKLIGSNEYETYTLKNDIDVSSANQIDAVIKGNFNSVLNGNGHSIIGLNSALFENINNGAVKNLKVLNSTITKKEKNSVGVIANQANHGKFENINIDQVKLEGRDYTGVVVGHDYTGSNFHKIQIRNAQVKSTGVYVGSFVGRSVGSTISDVAILDSNVDVQRKTTGGFIGTAKDTNIDHIYSSANLVINSYADEDLTSAGFIGNVEGKTTINHAFAAGNVQNKVADKTFYKFVGTPNVITEQVKSSYELENTTGKSNITEETKAQLAVATEEQQKTKTFYTQNLTFQEDTWNLEWIQEKAYPELKGMESKLVLHIKEISDIAQMNEYPNETFVLDNDIDFTKQKELTTIIQEFGGTFNGNGHKLIGLTQPLFKDLSGTVSNLVLTKTTILSDGTTNQGALAIKAKGAVVDQITIEGSEISSNSGNIASLIGTIENSNIRNIHISNSKLKGNTTHLAGFAVDVKNSTIANVVQQVKLELNVDTKQLQESAGFIVSNDEQTKIMNVISTGDVPVNVPKLMSQVNQITNGYEFAGASGKTQIQNNHVSEVKDNLWDKNFYQSQLKLDSSIWNLERVHELGYPVLKNNTQNEYQPIRLEISKPEDFNKLNKLPSKSFYITKDIDLSSYTGTLVTQKFTGVLDGNQHVISHLNQSLFQELSGTVRNLILQEVKVVNENGAANALARTANKATVNKLYVNGMTLSGGSHTGLIGTETGSNYDNIGIENVKVYANDQYAAIFLAEINNPTGVQSDLKYILIGNGDIYSEGKQYVGGMIGKINSAKARYLISDVDLHLKQNMQNSHSSSFIGSNAGSFNFRFAAVLGGSYVNNNGSNVWKITHIENESNPVELNGWSDVFHNSNKPGKVVAHRGIKTPSPWVFGGITSTSFYESDLVLESNIWNITTAPSKGYPTLKGMPTTKHEAPQLN